MFTTLLKHVSITEAIRVEMGKELGCTAKAVTHRIAKLKMIANGRSGKDDAAAGSTTGSTSPAKRKRTTKPKTGNADFEEDDEDDEEPAQAKKTKAAKSTAAKNKDVKVKEEETKEEDIFGSGIGDDDENHSALYLDGEYGDEGI